jgi:hypothetical protein
VEYSVNGRRFAQTVYDSLKIAGMRQVERLGGPTKAATLSRALQSHLSKAISVAWPDSYMCIDQAVDYDSQVGEPVIVRAMADALGCDVTSRETKAPHETLCTLLAAVNRKSAEVGSTFLEADEDHRITEEERQRVRRALEEAIDTMRQALVAITVEPTLRAVG